MAARVAVIGSGIAGLSAADELMKAGSDVVVLEKEARVGGRMSNEMLGSLKVVTGASVLFGFYRDMRELIRETGLADRVVDYPDGEAATLVTAAGEFDVDASGSPLQLLRTRALGLPSKLRLPTLLPDLYDARRRTDPNMAHTAEHLDDESLAEYLPRKVGRDLLDNIVEPFFRANWNWEPENISKAYFVPLMAHLGGRLRPFTFHYVLKTPPPRFSRFYGRTHPSKLTIFSGHPGDPNVPGKAPHLYCELSPQAVVEYLERGKEGIDDYVRPYVRELYPELDDQIAEIHEQWWDTMLPTFPPGYIRDLAAFLRAQQRSPLPRLAFVGDYLSHAHTGGACASGVRTGRRLAQELRDGGAKG